MPDDPLNLLIIGLMQNLWTCGCWQSVTGASCRGTLVTIQKSVRSNDCGRGELKRYLLRPVAAFLSHSTHCYRLYEQMLWNLFSAAALGQQTKRRRSTRPKNRLSWHVPSIRVFAMMVYSHQPLTLLETLVVHVEDWACIRRGSCR